jgi:hypothetical protein
MVWAIGNRLIYYGQAELWLVVLITALIAASGLSFDFDGVIEFTKGGSE